MEYVYADYYLNIFFLINVTMTFDQCDMVTNTQTREENPLLHFIFYVTLIGPHYPPCWGQRLSLAKVERMFPSPSTAEGPQPVLSLLLSSSARNNLLLPCSLLIQTAAVHETITKTWKIYVHVKICNMWTCFAVTEVQEYNASLLFTSVSNRDRNVLCWRTRAQTHTHTQNARTRAHTQHCWYVTSYDFIPLVLSEETVAHRNGWDNGYNRLRSAYLCRFNTSVKCLPLYWYGELTWQIKDISSFLLFINQPAPAIPPPPKHTLWECQQMAHRMMCQRF